MSIFAIHLYLRKERESDPIVDFTDLFDRFIGFWFLVGELIAGKSENHEVIMRVSIPKGFELFELRSETTLCGSIDDEKDFASIVL